MARRKHDAYYTSKKVGQALLAELVSMRYEIKGDTLGRVFEPCAGDGQLASVLAPHARKLVTNDLFVRWKHDAWLDAADERTWHKLGLFDWTITNPPYSGNVLVPILQNALVHSYRVAALLRLSFLEPTIERNPRERFLRDWSDNLRAVIPISGPRPSFTNDGKTDSVTVAWFIWDLGWSWQMVGARGIPCPFRFITRWNE